MLPYISFALGRSEPEPMGVAVACSALLRLSFVASGSSVRIGGQGEMGSRGEVICAEETDLGRGPGARVEAKAVTILLLRVDMRASSLIVV
jgi:hypothetical protein